MSKDIKISELNNFEEQTKRHDGYLSYPVSADYTGTSVDKVKLIRFIDYDGNITYDVPNANGNLDRVLEFRNNNSYTYGGSNDNSRKVIVDAGTGTLDYAGIQQNTIDIERINCGIRIKSNGTSWDVLDVFGARLGDISGTLEMIYDKYFIGTTAAGALTQINHGVNMHQIVHLSGKVYDTGLSGYEVYDCLITSVANSQYYIQIVAAQIYINSVGANLQSQAYQLKMEYYI